MGRNTFDDLYQRSHNYYVNHVSACNPCESRAMKETFSEAEVVLQPPLSQKEMDCAEQVAMELDLLTEKVSKNVGRVSWSRCNCYRVDLSAVIRIQYSA